jgi:hypothetical protein
LIFRVLASEHPRMPSLRELKQDLTFGDLMLCHAILDAQEDAAAARRERDARAPR